MVKGGARTAGNKEEISHRNRIMNSLKLGLTAFLALSVVTSLTSAGTALVTSPRGAQTYSAATTGTVADGDLAHRSLTAGSPRGAATMAPAKEAGQGMDCCSAVLRPVVTLSGRASDQLPALRNPAPTGTKCSMGAQPGSKAGCCKPAKSSRPACCG